MTVAEFHKELSLLIEQGHANTRVIANIIEIAIVCLSLCDLWYFLIRSWINIFLNTILILIQVYNLIELKKE